MTRLSQMIEVRDALIGNSSKSWREYPIGKSLYGRVGNDREQIIEFAYEVTNYGNEQYELRLLLRGRTGMRLYWNVGNGHAHIITLHWPDQWLEPLFARIGRPTAEIIPFTKRSG